MKVTKFTHSCVRLESADGALVLDPGSFSNADELQLAVDGVEAILVTHEHPDHLHVGAVADLLAERSQLRVWGPQPVADLLADRSDALRERVSVVGAWEEFEAGGFAVTSHGGQHALIHPDVPVVPNVAYLVAGSVLHPGDSFTVPTNPVETLLLPLHAPWSRVSEVLDHLVAVRAGTVHAIHDGLLNDRGRAVVEGHVRRVAEAYGPRYAPLRVGESTGG